LSSLRLIPGYTVMIYKLNSNL